MISHKVFRTSIFVLAFLAGLLRESIAQGHEFSPAGDNPALLQPFGNIQPR